MDANEINKYVGRKKIARLKNQLQNNCTFKPQEKFFRLHSGGIAGERAVMTDNTVARNNNGKRIASVRRADGAEAAGHPDSPRELFVGDGCSIRDAQQLLPYPQLKGSSYLINRGGKFCELAVKIPVQLIDGFLVATLIFNDIIVVKVNGEPIKKIFFRFFRNTDFANPVIGRSDVDVADLRIE